MHYFTLALLLGGLLVGQAPLPLEQTVVEEIDQSIVSWDLDGAEELIAEKAAQSPTHPILDILEAKRRFYSGAYNDSLALMESVPESWKSEGVKELEGLIASTSKGQSGYVSVPSREGHFLITYHPALDTPTALLAVDYLEAIRESVGEVFGVYPESPVRVEILAGAGDLSAMSALTASDIDATGTIALCKYAKIMITSPRVLVYGYPWVDTLTHEYIHYVLTLTTKDHMEVWLQEGLAKYFETIWSPDGRPGLPRFMRVLLADAAKKKKLIELEEMSPSLAKLPDQRSSVLAYAQAASIVELVVLQEGKDSVPEIITAIAEGASTREAIDAQTGIPFKNFLAVWRKHIRKLSYSPKETQLYPKLVFESPDLQAAPLAHALSSSKALEHVHIGDLLLVRKKLAPAEIEYDKAIKTFGIPAPDLAAKKAMALLEQGKAKATATLLEPFSVDFPNHLLVHILYGEALVSIGELEEARAPLERVLTINPYDPSLYELLKKVYAATDDTEGLVRIEAIAATLPKL